MMGNDEGATIVVAWHLNLSRVFVFFFFFSRGGAEDS